MKSSGVPEDECRPGASAWECWLWFVALLPVRGSWSSCVFVRPTVVAFWGDAFSLRSRGLLAASGFTQIWLHLVFCRAERTLAQAKRFHANLVATSCFAAEGTFLLTSGTTQICLHLVFYRVGAFRLAQSTLGLLFLVLGFSADRLENHCFTGRGSWLLEGCS